MNMSQHEHSTNKLQLAIEKLQNGSVVCLALKGNSMTPRIKSGQAVILDPIKPETVLEVGDAILCKVKGKIYLHKIVAFGCSKHCKDDHHVYDYQIGNNHGGVNGWTNRTHIYGKLRD